MSEFFLRKPKNFHSSLEVSTVFMEFERTLLLLKRRSDKKIAPNTWGVPGGKLEKEETPLQGLKREIKEELQLVPPRGALRWKKSLYVRHPMVEYRLHLFKWVLNEKLAVITLSQEHEAYLWQPIEKFKDLPLLEGQLEAFYFIYPH